MAFQPAAKPTAQDKRDEKLSGVSLRGAQRRRTLALAIREELKNLELSGELVRRSAVKQEEFRVLREVRDALENLPARLSGIFAAEHDQQRIFALFSTEIQQVLEGLTKE